MQYIIYWLISENQKNSYVGFSHDISSRLLYHKKGKVKSTQDFEKFRCFHLEDVDTLQKARNRECYWKSAVGRKKLKRYFDKIISINNSSNG
ncbi:MAG: GIY-YIG nuclease family protein [bacterium]|nr:GIY-YIG nuclease family protein [bacterium]